MFDRLGARLEKMAAERPVFLAFLVFVGAAVLVIPLSLPYYLAYPEDMWINVLAEAHGTLFDLLIIGWFLLWLNKMAERRVQNNRYREEIDDYLGWRSPEATHRVAGNIRRLNRNGVDKEMKLTEAYLNGANLAGAHLRETDLWGAQLEGTSLREADLRGANLAGANLENADLERAILARADLRGASLKEADLERADMAEADLRGASLTGADLQYAALGGANLERANLTGANLRGASLRAAVLKGADLEDANLRGAVLEDADITGVNLKGADLLGANLMGARLPVDNDLFSTFEKAKSLFGVELPPGVEEKLQEAYPRLFQMAHEGGYDATHRPPSAGPPEDRRPEPAREA